DLWTGQLWRRTFFRQRKFHRIRWKNIQCPCCCAWPEPRRGRNRCRRSGKLQRERQPPIAMLPIALKSPSILRRIRLPSCSRSDCPTTEDPSISRSADRRLCREENNRGKFCESI